MATRVDPGVAKRWGLPAGATAWPTVLLSLTAWTVQGTAIALAVSGRLHPALAVAIGTLAAYVQFTVTHDAAHRAVSRRPLLNDAVGWVAAAALAAPFAAFRKIHLHHHAHTNDPAEDPDFWVVGRSWPGTLARFFTTWPHYYRFYFTRLVAKDGVLLQTVAGILLLLAVLGASFATGHLGAALLYWVLPAQLAVAALALLFDYLPHRPHTERGRLRDTVAIDVETAAARRLLDTGFLAQNLHLLHHLFPTIPWYRYRRAYDEIVDGIRAEGGEVRSLRQVLASLPPRLSRGLVYGRRSS